MAKRSIARKSIVGAKHTLLKVKKKRRVRRQITELESRIDKDKMMRDLLLRGSITLKKLGKIAGSQRDRQSEKLANFAGGNIQDLVSDMSMKKFKQETSLKRKRKQLEALKGRKKKQK